MKYLIDTHILIWIAISPEKISKNILEVLENPENNIYVSTVSFLEIAIKSSVGKLNLNGIEIDDLVRLCEEYGIQIIQLPPEAVSTYRKLPLHVNHKDPFDRTLISICISNNFILLSVDAKISAYKDSGLNYIS